MKQITIKIEAKNYDVSIHETMHSAITLAIAELGGENISAKKLLEAYLAKVIECKQLQDELKAIDKLVNEALQ